MVQGLKFIEHSRQLNYGKHSPFFIRSCSQLLVSIDQNFKYAWKRKKKKILSIDHLGLIWTDKNDIKKNVNLPLGSFMLRALW